MSTHPTVKPKNADEAQKGRTAVVLLSGGIDSATCLGIAAKKFDRIMPVFVRYGQQTVDVEQRMAKWQAENFRGLYPGMPIDELRVINYSSVFGHFQAGLADPDKSFEHMVEEDGRSSGYVPMRNLHLIASAAGIADVADADAVYHGAQGGDEADYPDCRPKFMDAAEQAINHSIPESQRIALRTPLLNLSKPEVIAKGAKVGVDFVATYSCYTAVDDPNNPKPCGACPACEERSAAFEEAGITDPYEVKV